MNFKKTSAISGDSPMVVNIFEKCEAEPNSETPRFYRFGGICVVVHLDGKE